MQDFYKDNYKKLIFVPLIILLPLIFFVFVSPGISLGIELTGGNVLIIRSEKEFSVSEIENILAENLELKEVSVSAVNSPTSHGAYIEYSKDENILLAEGLLGAAQEAVINGDDELAIRNSVSVINIVSGEDVNFVNSRAAVLAAQEAVGEYNEKFSVKLQSLLSEKLSLGSSAEFQRREVSPTLGKASLESGFFIALVSAVFLIIIIFVSFRMLVPSFAIMFAMVIDVLFGLSGMALFNIPLSLLTLSTLLMVVGMSVDTNIMLTSRVLKERTGSASERATSSLKTGLTMSSTTLAALVAMIVVSYFTQMELVFDIAMILIFGLVGDLFATWCFNSSVLVWLSERVKK